MIKDSCARRNKFLSLYKMLLLVCRRTYTERVVQEVAEGGVWSWEGGSGRRVEKYGWWGFLGLPFNDKYLRHYATNWKVAGSIPNGVIGIFHWHNSSGRTMALGLTQPLTEMSTRNISLGSKGGRCVGLTTLPPHVPVVFKSGNLNLLETSEPVQVCNGIVLPLLKW